MQKLFDVLVELACWVGILITLWVVFDTTTAEIRFNQAVGNIPPIVYNNKGE